MSIDLEHEELITLGEATRYVPRRKGKRVHASSLWRWIRFGHRGILLEAIRTPAQWCTTRQAVQRFFARLADLDRPAPRKMDPQMEANERLKRLKAQAAKSLRKAGFDPKSVGNVAN